MMGGKGGRKEQKGQIKVSSAPVAFPTLLLRSADSPNFQSDRAATDLSEMSEWSQKVTDCL